MVKVDGARLWSSLMEMSELGRLPNGGCRRLALSDEDRAARDLFVRWAKEAGANVQHDCFGNIFATRAGTDPKRPVILTGSHLDSQPNGGHFDGVYGVLAGLEVLRAMNDCDYRSSASICVVNWTNEEGARFAPGLTGSAGFAGLLDPDQVRGLHAIDGATFGSELDRIGYAGPPLSQELTVGAYIEAHIEQGPVLEAIGKPVGIVVGVQGARWYEIRIAGSSRHAGTTPMDIRSDAFMAAAVLATRLRRAGLLLSPDMRITFGRISVEPGSPNTIPDRVRLALDLRHPAEESLQYFEHTMSEVCSDVADQERVSIDWERTMLVPSVRFDARCIKVLEDAAERHDVMCERMTSGAMHDACSIARIAPTAMLFAPCKGGISHNEAEWARPEDLSIGCQVLGSAILQLAE